MFLATQSMVFFKGSYKMAHKKHSAERVPGKRKGRVSTACTLQISNNTNIDADTGNFIFGAGPTGNQVNAATPPVTAGTTVTVQFNWPFDGRWDWYTGVINPVPDVGFLWVWNHDGITTEDFPNQAVEMD